MNITTALNTLHAVRGYVSWTRNNAVGYEIELIDHDLENLAELIQIFKKADPDIFEKLHGDLDDAVADAERQILAAE